MPLKELVFFKKSAIILKVYICVISEVNDMQDMIKRIIQADNEVKAIKEANEEAAEKDKHRIEAEIAAIQKRYDQAAQAEIAKDREYLDKLFAKKTAEVTKKQEEARLRLRENYDRSREKWVDELVSRVLSREEAL